MNEKQFKCSECDFTFENYTHLTNTWSDKFTLPWEDTEYMFLGKQDSEYNIWKNQNFGHTKMYNLISNKQNTTKLKATKLTQGKKVLEGTTEGKIKIMLRGQNLEGKKWGQKQCKGKTLSNKTYTGQKKY